MLRGFHLAVVILVLCSPVVVFAQNLCPTGVKSDKLICLIPQVYGDGLPFKLNGSAAFNIVVVPHFLNVLPDSLKPLNSAIAKQSALLPLASPSSGLTFEMDPGVKLPIPSTDTFGPILSERAETIGKHRAFLGFDYQYFRFGTLDGIDLKNLPVVFLQPDDSVAVSGRTCSINQAGTPANTGPCGFIRDVIRVQNRLDLKIQQFTTFFTFGLTNRIDISLAIPLQDIHMAISSQATIVDNSMTGLHSFQVPGCASPCTTASFSNFGTATGIGDLNLRVKGTAWKGEKAALALGTDIRLPTGDSLNFLGAGTAGIKPFVVWSYRSKISPHASAGFETNGSSVLSGDISTGTKERFPGQLTYSGGADMWITSWLTGAIDIVGQEVLQSKRTVLTSLTEPAACQDGFCTECPALGPGGCSSSFLLPKTDSVISQATGSYNITSLSLGARIRPVSNLLMTGNVLLKLNDGGLRSTAVPLLGISYTF